MSRNLASTCCGICYASDIKLEEVPRPITKEEAGAYANEFVGNLVVANASCAGCGAKYLAWVSHDFPPSTYSGRWERHAHPEFQPYVDLSYRAAFNDEPAPEDLPAPDVLARIHREQYMRKAAELRAEAAEKIREAEEQERIAVAEKSHWELYRRL